jgi:hypothetical protein
MASAITICCDTDRPELYSAVNKNKLSPPMLVQRYDSNIEISIKLENQNEEHNNLLQMIPRVQPLLNYVL